MDFVIQPYESVGPIRLGMTRDELKQVLGGRVDLIPPWRRQDIPQDYFADYSIRIAYKKAEQNLDVCDAVQLSLPSSPILFSRPLLKSRSIENMKDWLASMDDNVMLLPSTGIISLKFGVLLANESYASFKHKRPSSVVVFDKGSYDEIIELGH
jgi:hypothetical protein